MTVKLAEITETRKTVLIEPDENAFDFSQATPGLHLKFNLAVEEGLHVLELRQPEKVVAHDAKGNDLSQIEEGFSGERVWAEIGMSFDGPPESLTFHLTAPARDAEHFSVQATVDAVVYSGTRELELDAGDEWVDLDPAAFGGQKVRMRFGEAGGFFGDTRGVTFVPSSAREYIEDLSILIDGETLESQGSVWDDSEITYIFEEGAEKPKARVRLLLRTDVRTAPLTIDVRKQPLS